MLGESEIPNNLNFNEGVFNSGSNYFSLSQASNSFFYDGDNWILSHRGILKWIKPHIESGSGQNDIYAITIEEEGITPTIYSLDG